MDVKEQNPGHFVDKQEAHDGDVKQKKHQNRGHHRHTNAFLRDKGEQLNEPKPEEPTFLHVGVLKAVFVKIQHPFGVGEHVRVVQQQQHRDKGVEGHEGHDSKVQMNQLSNELLASVRHVVVKR